VYLKIEPDRARFKQIIRGRIKSELRRFIREGELIGKQGNDLISIPLPQIDLPRFMYGSKEMGGVGQGEGEPGGSIGDDAVEGVEKKAGNQPGHHIMEVDVTLEELAEMLGEELELPRIEPKGSSRLIAEKERYTGISSTGPESLRHFRRTYKEALKRQIIAGTYKPDEPFVVPIRDDSRYRVWKQHLRPERNAVIIYMMDVSGSMGSEQKEIVRIASFWIDTWIRSQYEGVDIRYIVHDAVAREVDREVFYHTRESGGTIISSAYRLCLQLIKENYCSQEWNIYPFHFSDGDNWSGNDTRECIKILGDEILPLCNVFSYGQVESEYGSGQFMKDLEESYNENEILRMSAIPSRDSIYDSIKEFLGKGT
jgi:uncharacterized protein